MTLEATPTDRPASILNAGDRIRFTKRAAIWLWYERGTVGAFWSHQREGWAILDSTTRCGECGSPKPRTVRFRYDEVEPL
jgi:hypothetical protein